MGTGFLLRVNIKMCKAIQELTNYKLNRVTKNWSIEISSARYYVGHAKATPSATLFCQPNAKVYVPIREELYVTRFKW